MGLFNALSRLAALINFDSWPSLPEIIARIFVLVGFVRQLVQLIIERFSRKRKAAQWKFKQSPVDFAPLDFAECATELALEVQRLSTVVQHASGKTLVLEVEGSLARLSRIVSRLGRLVTDAIDAGDGRIAKAERRLRTASLADAYSVQLKEAQFIENRVALRVRTGPRNPPIRISPGTLGLCVVMVAFFVVVSLGVSRSATERARANQCVANLRSAQAQLARGSLQSAADLARAFLEERDLCTETRMELSTVLYNAVKQQIYGGVFGDSTTTAQQWVEARRQAEMNGVSVEPLWTSFEYAFQARQWLLARTIFLQAWQEHPDLTRVGAYSLILYNLGSRSEDRQTRAELLATACAISEIYAGGGEACSADAAMRASESAADPLKNDPVLSSLRHG